MKKNIFEVSQPKGNIAIISHIDCMDGLASASIMFELYKRDGWDPTVYYIQYKNEHKTIEALKNSESTIHKIIFTDFSLKCNEMIEFCNYFNDIEIEVFDHHKTAESELEMAQLDCPNLSVLFDNDRSGAMICWDHCTHKKPELKEIFPEWIYEYIQDRDLWRWKLAHSVFISEAMKLNIEKNNIYDFMDFCKKATPSSLVEAGIVLEQKTRQMVTSKLAKVSEINVKGYTLKCLNATENISEIGNAICINYHKPALMYFITDDLQLVCSLRSTDDLPDISELAKSFPGGGGHRNAAGFSLELNKLEDLLNSRI
jgi:oligoribonuclease NrnB/cAMP/cGMP phosphodiesterase (DHH superfamily)